MATPRVCNNTHFQLLLPTLLFVALGCWLLVIGCWLLAEFIVSVILRTSVHNICRSFHSSLSQHLIRIYYTAPYRAVASQIDFPQDHAVDDGPRSTGFAPGYMYYYSTGFVDCMAITPKVWCAKAQKSEK